MTSVYVCNIDVHCTPTIVVPIYKPLQKHPKVFGIQYKYNMHTTQQFSLLHNANPTPVQIMFKGRGSKHVQRHSILTKFIMFTHNPVQYAHHIGWNNTSIEHWVNAIHCQCALLFAVYIWAICK